MIEKDVQIEGTLRSKSWKITRPFRNIAHQIRRMKSGIKIGINLYFWIYRNKTMIPVYFLKIYETLKQEGMPSLCNKIRKKLARKSDETFTYLNGQEYPLELDVAYYREMYIDLQNMSEQELMQHYDNHGRQEGRIANKIKDRFDFSSLITAEMRALEIGPFASPLLVGSNVAYADYLSKNDLISRAKNIGIDPSSVPEIKYVLSEIALGDIDLDYDALISSHLIEHQPDLIRHLNQAYKLTNRRSGRYFLLIPDKRYCFDRNIKESTIADVIDAHESGRTVHSLKSIIEHRALTTHNDPGLHWENKGVEYYRPRSEVVKSAIAEWKNAAGGYIDVHSWQFTPDSFISIIENLRDLNYIRWGIERVYSTRYGSNEFWVILKSH